MIDFQIEILKKLKIDNTLSYDEILSITDAFQIASGQSYAIGRTKGILDFLKNHGEILVVNIPNGSDLALKSAFDLSNLYLSIDKYIDICHDKIFFQYFENNIQI
jgi:hypothetical protein